MDVCVAGTCRYLRSLGRFAASLFVYTVVKGVPSEALALLPIFPILFIPNPVLLWLDALIQEVLSTWYGYPPEQAGEGARYFNVNLGFGTHEWTFPAGTAHAFLALPRQEPWSPHAARVLCMLSKIAYEEFLDARVCQALLCGLPLVAELVAGFQFRAIDFEGQPPGGVDLQSVQVAVIRLADPADAARAALVVAFRGSEPFVQADCSMDFDFIAAARGDAPAVGRVHQGFRYGLGLGAGLGNLPGVTTRFRYVFSASKKPRVDRQAASAFSIIADVLRRVPGPPIYVTGHSLGGGMAHLFAVALARREPALGARLATLYPFAAPRIGDRRFADTSDGLLHRHYRVANAIDIVPRVPPTRSTWLPGKPLGALEGLLGLTIIDYQHAGTSRLAERIVQPPEPLPVDHTAAGRDREPPSITAPRALRFGLGKLAWGATCCAALPPLRAACAALGREPPMWARAPRETVLRVALRAPPPLWPISDHFVGAYCNMFWSPA